MNKELKKLLATLLKDRGIPLVEGTEVGIDPDGEIRVGAFKTEKDFYPTGEEIRQIKALTQRPLETYNYFTFENNLSCSTEELKNV